MAAKRPASAARKAPAAKLDPSTEHLRAALAELADRLARLASSPGNAERFAGQELVPAGPSGSRLTDLATSFGLEPVDLGLLTVALAPALDDRFGSLFADRAGIRDARRPTAGLALSLAGGSPWSAEDRARLAPDSRLRRVALLEFDDSTVPALDARLTVPERVVAHLLGDDAADPRLASMLAPAAPLELAEVIELAKALATGQWAVWIRDVVGGGPSLGASALGLLGAPAVVIDLARQGPGAGLADVLAVAVREAVLNAGGLVVSSCDSRRDQHGLGSLFEAPPCPIILVSHSAWDPAGSRAVPLLADMPRLEPPTRRLVWQHALSQIGVDDATVVGELSNLRLGPEQILGAAVAAGALAATKGEPVSSNHLHDAALAYNAGRLEQLAHRVVPRATFDDLVLPAALLDELRSVVGRYRSRHIVRDEWGMDRAASRGRGITCLFAGPSGTGKTLAAEVVADSLGVDLFVIDLSQVVDKYIGETEKNLERVFQEAEGLNGVLLFDEADALFGKRSDVRDAHDRHANVEVAYLLQRMERYEGVAVLTTNLRANLDEAFSRRLDVLCAFPEPGEKERLLLWQRHLPPSVPLGDDLDLALLAKALAMPGGLIRNITLAAAFSAAIEGTPIDMRHLVVAAKREHTKLGRLFDPTPFAAWAQHLAD